MTHEWRPGDLAIDASAGYGKTEILCSRLLAMLLSDPDMPRSMVALTFTRAAAGEIYTRLLTLLVGALRDDGSAAELRRKLGALVAPGAFDDTTREQLLKLLRRLIDDMGVLNINTIDGFFYQLVRVFAIELGLPGAAELAAGDGEKTETKALLQELFSAASADDDFVSACRESRYGEEKKRCFDTCRELLEMAERYRAYRDDPDFWGGKFRKFVPADPRRLEEALIVCESHDWGKAKYREKLSPVLHSCAAAATAEHRFTRGELDVLRKFFDVWHDFPVIKPDRFKQDWDYPEPVASAIRTLMDNARRILIAQCARRTEALRKLLTGFRELYDLRMLRRGKLNFSDLPFLLLEQPEDGEFIAEVQYRANSRFRHFLIDEFQDTSRDQWHVLAPMTGDNGEGDHSLFIVGDVKQAIYGWRKGDSKLMGEVAQHMSKQRLERSFRYGKEICEALNLLFGSAAENAALPVQTAKRWGEIFVPHEPAEGVTEPGELEVLALTPDQGSDAKEFSEVSAKLILERLEQLKFFSGGLSGGVLVRSKKHGIMLRDALLGLVSPEFADSIIWEGDESIAGDPLVASLLEFGASIQHPGNTLASGTVRMNPLMAELLPANDEERLAWASLIAERGVHGFLREVLKKLAARIGGDPSRRPTVGGAKIDALLEFAERFDASGGNGDMLRFRSAAAEFRKPPAAVGGKLRLLTIHHSKGLTFDVVFHPMFNPRSGNYLRPDTRELVSGGGSADDPAWVMLRPREEGMTDREIAGALMSHHADKCFEELCTLYVALTRARRGVYVYLPPRAKAKREAYHPDWKEKGVFRTRKKFSSLDKVSYYASDMVFEAFFDDPELFPIDAPLPVERRKGASFLRRAFGVQWQGTLKTKKIEVVPPLVFDFPPEPPRPGRTAPSHIEGSRQLRFALPRPDRGEMLGTRIHAFFERIGSWSGFQPPPDTEAEIMEHYRACTAEPGIAALLDEKCELWRERPFDVLLDNGEGAKILVTGCFDRVQIYRDGSGGVERAVIIDYKSNLVSEETLAETGEHYRPQLETYRRALATLLGTTPNSIECRLIFTRLGRMVAL